MHIGQDKEILYPTKKDILVFMMYKNLKIMTFCFRYNEPIPRTLERDMPCSFIIVLNSIVDVGCVNIVSLFIAL